MRIFSTLFSSEVVYVRPGGQLRQKRGWFASRWGPLLRAHSRCSGGHPPERSGSHSWSSSFMRGRKSGGGRSYIRARVAVARASRGLVYVWGLVIAIATPACSQGYTVSSLSARVCSTLCAVVSRIWRKGNGGDKAIRKTSGTNVAVISAARIRSRHRRDVTLKTRRICFLAKF